METTTIEVFFWYCLGIISCLGVTKILKYGSLHNLYNQAIISILNLAYLIDQESEAMEEYRYNIIREKTGDEAETIIAADERAKEVWRYMIIQTIVTLTPPHLRSGLQFKTWKQAVRLIEKHRNGGNNASH